MGASGSRDDADGASVRSAAPEELEREGGGRSAHRADARPGEGRRASGSSRATRTTKAIGATALEPGGVRPERAVVGVLGAAAGRIVVHPERFGMPMVQQRIRAGQAAACAQEEREQQPGADPGEHGQAASATRAW